MSNCFLYFVFARKMKDLQAIVNETRTISRRGRMSPQKKKRVETVTPIRVVPIRSESGDLLQLPRVWFDPDRCGPHSTLFLDDPELRVIHDLGPAGRSKAITEGFIVAIKALEVATTLNNASMEGQVLTDVLVKERDALDAKVSQLEGGAADVRSVAEERDRRIAALENQLTNARTTLEQEVESSSKLVEEKKALEESSKGADLPWEDEMEDMAVLKHADLVERVSALEGSLVDDGIKPQVHVLPV